MGDLPIVIPEDVDHFRYAVPDDMPPGPHRWLLEAKRDYHHSGLEFRRQRLLAAEVFLAVYVTPLDPVQSRRLASVARSKAVPSPPGDLVTDAKRRLREAKTPKGREKAEEGIRAASVELAILRAREEGLNRHWQQKVAEYLLRRVT